MLPAWNVVKPGDKGAPWKKGFLQGDAGAEGVNG